MSCRDRLTDCWRRRRLTRPRVKRVVYFEGRSDVPEVLARDTLAVVGTRRRPKWAVLECPCGRGHQLVVSLSQQHRPYWRLDEDRRGPSLAPSIDSHRPYRCHFWLRDGQIMWARS